jgi:hypothetical protein
VHKGTPRECVACHAPDDVHAGSRGTQCRDCHTAASWSTARFDHELKTGFALEGKHSILDCAACHQGGRLSDPLPRDCAGCHRKDDRHALRFGTACGDCHSSQAWRVARFDHTARTGFELAGAHATARCHDCHTSKVATQKLTGDCRSCHRAEDVHGSALGNDCGNCHGSGRWDADIAFDHDLTSFPLHGLHVVVTCGQCHATKAFRGTASQCNDCHARDDVHKGGLGTDCAACHSPNGWDLWQFDHGNRTRFPLTGAHEALACRGCHVKPATLVRLPMDCAACHASDDTHGGRFGRQCDRCHSTSTFAGARPGRETQP